MTRTIVLTGARGGQGTSAVAAALAVFAAGHGPTLLRSDDPPATTALFGVPRHDDDEVIEVCPNLTFRPGVAGIVPAAAYETVVVDGGRTPIGPFDERQLPPCGDQHCSETVERYDVLRGPCYVALTTLLTTGRRCDGIIVLTEPGRALSERDVIDVLGIPVVATIAVEPAVARTIDAGILLSRLHRHASFRALRRLAQPRAPLTTTPLQIDTDLHLSLSDRNEARPVCRDHSLAGAVCRAWTPHSPASNCVEHRQALTRCR